MELQFKHNRLKYLRERGGYTLRKLSELTGIDFTTIGYCERGMRNFSANTIQILTAFFGVSADYLLGKSAVSIYDDFVKSIENDFLTEKVYNDGTVLRVISDEVPDPYRQKFEILLKIQSVNSVDELNKIYAKITDASAVEDFNDGGSY